MIAGPVFHFELVRTARQRRFYLVRFLFGLVLLGIIGMNYATFASRRWFMDEAFGGTLSTREMNAFGYTIFTSMMVAQAALVLGLTPALVADSVASERQRKTLHYLMTSRLKGVEIVLGKLAARLLNLGTYLAAALPVVSLLTLFGGVDPTMIVLSYAAIGSTAFFLASLAILASVTSRRSRDAVASAYGLGALWLVGPPTIAFVVPAAISGIADLYNEYGTTARVDPAAFALTVLVLFALAALAILVSGLVRGRSDAVGLTYSLLALWMIGPPLVAAVVPLVTSPTSTATDWARTASGWLVPEGPLELLNKAGSIYQGKLDAVWWSVARMFGSQVAFGTLLVAIAAWQVRPAFRRLESRSERPAKGRSGSRRWLARRPCGDDPIYWKEAFFLRSGGGITRRFARMLVPILLVSISFGILYYLAGDSFREAWSNGFGENDWQHAQHRVALNMALRVAGTGIFAFWMLQLAGLASATFTSEREQDTWISLLATPLEGPEILRGKMFGALRTTAHFGVTLAALWLIGVAAGAVHPLGMVLTLAMASMFTWFVLALGTFASLKAKTTWRAQVATQGIIIGPHLCCVFYAPSIIAVMGLSLLSFSDVRGLLEIDLRWTYGGPIWPMVLGVAYLTLYVVGGLAFYLGGAYFLTRASFRGFDATADRPRRSSRPSRIPTDPKKAEPDGLVEVEIV